MARRDGRDLRPRLPAAHRVNQPLRLRVWTVPAGRDHSDDCPRRGADARDPRSSLSDTIELSGRRAAHLPVEGSGPRVPSG